MTHLSDITPLILTFNEAPNIGRCLENLRWAKKIVVLDSGSDDETSSIVSTFPNAVLIQRPFDTHAEQWAYGVASDEILTSWILALDADYMVSDDVRRFIEEGVGPSISGLSFPVKYAVFGKIIRSGIYPPVVALFQRRRGCYVQDGHTQRLVVDGPVAHSPYCLVHDDRKSLDRWIKAQLAYARLEASKLLGKPKGFRAFLRRNTPLSPLAVAIYCLVVRGGAFEGAAGWLYAFQRMIAEALICLSLQDRRLRLERDGIAPSSR